MKLIQHWEAYRGPKDERVEAETNRIYKVGFIMLSIGLVLYMYYGSALKQATYMRDVMATGTGKVVIASSDLFLYGWVLLTAIVCIVLQCRKGFTDNGRFAEAETFPIGYYALRSCFVSVIVGMLTPAIRVLAEFQILGADGIMWWAAAFPGVFVAVAMFLMLMFLFWTGFKTAQSRRKQLEMRLGE